MIASSASPPHHHDDAAAVVDVDDGAFAATIAEELIDADDPEALPGAIPVDDRPLQSLPTIGHVGRYALKYLLGSGGLGTVHAALDPLLSRPIAVKTLHVDASVEQRESLESQLLAEARAAAGLNHPHIVTVYDAGLSEQGVYIAMERLQGRDLRDLLADGWRPEPGQAARIAKRIADALAYAHGHGVVHCDIKPANIYMIGRTQPKLLDFGIARVAQQQGHAHVTPSTDGKVGKVDIALAAANVPPADLGTPYYVSPEQLRGEALDQRCDVYGVGVVLYELLTGRRAFEGRTLESIRAAVLEADVALASRVNRNVNSALAAIVARAMARNPAQRYRSARHLSRALRTWLDEDQSHQAGAPPGRGNWAWTAFATLGLAAAVAFWVVSVPEPAPATAAATSALPDLPVASATAVTAIQPLAAPLVDEAAKAVSGVALPKAARVDPAEVNRARERRLAREPAVVVATPAAQGTVQLAISPWGQVEINGVAAGTTPPLSRLTLPAGKHKVVVRNDDFPPFIATVTVDEEKPVTLRHRFGS